MGDFYFLFTPFQALNHTITARIAHIGAVFLPVLFIDFVFSVIKYKRLRLFIRVLYIYSFILEILNLFTNYFIKFASISFNPTSINVSVGYAYYVYLIVLLLLFVFIHIFLFIQYKNSKGIVRQQIQYFFLSLGLLLLSAFIYFPYVLGVPVIRIDNLLLAIYASVISYAITKHELFDVKVVVSRLTAFFTVAFLVATTTMYTFFSFKSKLLLILSILLLTLFWAFYADKIRLKIQTSAERKFVKNWYEPSQVIESITALVSKLLKREDIFRIIAKVLDELINIDGIKIISGRTNKNGKIDRYEFLDSKRDKVEYMDFISFCGNHKNPMQFSGLPVKIQFSLKDNNIFKDSLVLPFSSSSNLEGVIILGKKLSEEPYNKKDIDLFKTIIKLTEVYLDRLLPYEKIRVEYNKSLQIAEEYAQQAAFANLSKGIAHEIRNPLGALKAGAFVLKKNPENKEEVLNYANTTREVVNRLIKLTDTMLNYGDAASEEKDLYSIKDIICEVLTLLEPERRKQQTKIDTSFSIDPKILCDQHSIHHVFLNLLLNSFQAIQQKGEITIISEAHNFIDKDGKKQDGLLIKVQDNGPGMSADIVKNIFNPFYTTKYSNTGLGLSIVMRTIEAHKGMIDVESEPGKGTTFFIYLPV